MLAPCKLHIAGDCDFPEEGCGMGAAFLAGPVLSSATATAVGPSPHDERGSHRAPSLRPAVCLFRG